MRIASAKFEGKILYSKAQPFSTSITPEEKPQGVFKLMGCKARG
jgi:hypothetical protein